MTGTLESRSERTLTQLRETNVVVTPRVPVTWADMVDAFTNLFSSANRISLIARETTNPKQKDEQSANPPLLRVTQTFNRV